MFSPAADLCIDFYKSDHRRQYPKNTTLVCANFTARSAHLKNIPEDMFLGGTIFFGLQYFIVDFLINQWTSTFFHRSKDRVLERYKRRMDTALGPGAIPTLDHIAALHDLQYLPIKISAVEEGSFVPIRVPSLLIENTKDDFFWLTNYLETPLSAYIWKSITSATTAFHYYNHLTKAAIRTGGDRAFVKWQGHDFSFRGMSSIDDACKSGAGHLLSFTGTDTVPAIEFLEYFYFASADKELIGGSVGATEHSVMCLGTKTDEIGTIRRLITELYPSGIVSIVSDTWDFFKVITEYAAALKQEIMARQGKVVFRPDSGDPVKIICGDPDAEPGTPRYKGALECLWEVFGGSVNAKGFRVLDSHVGLIYGDSITPSRAQAILAQMEKKGLCSTNIVLGIGSFTYNHVTRDTYGHAVKTTFGIVNGEPRAIYKDPVTDVGSMKKSAKGRIHIYKREDVTIDFIDNVTSETDLTGKPSATKVVFLDGAMTSTTTLQQIRAKIEENNERFLLNM